MSCSLLAAPGRHKMTPCSINTNNCRPVLSLLPPCQIFLIFLLVCIFSPPCTKAAIIHNFDQTHFSASLHISGDLHVGREYLSIQELQSLEGMANDFSSCEGGYHLRKLGNFTDGDIYAQITSFHSMHSNGMHLNGEILVNGVRGMFRLNLANYHIESLEMPNYPLNAVRTGSSYFSTRAPGSHAYYVAAGWDGSTYDDTTWKYDLRATEWSLEASYPFEVHYARTECSVSRCYLQGGERTEGGSTKSRNVFLEFNYDDKLWTNQTTENTPYRMYHGLDYLPHLDALVVFGGYTWDFELDDNDFTDAVCVYHFNVSDWTCYSNPVQVDQGDVTIHSSLHPSSVVYNDAIFIITERMEVTTHFMKLLVFADAPPEYHYIPFGGDFTIEAAYLQGVVPILIQNHVLILGGIEGDTPTRQYRDILILSLC